MKANMINNFDFWHIFFGNFEFDIIIQILFRIIFMYIYTFLNLRYILKKHSLKQVNVFAFIIIIALGSAVGDPMFQIDIPLIYGMLTVTTVVLLERFISYISQRNSLLEHVFDGTAEILIINGKIDFNALEKQEITIDEFMSRLRTNGIEYIEEVKYAVIETSGQLAVIKNKETINKKTSTIENLLIKKI